MPRTATTRSASAKPAKPVKKLKPRQVVDRIMSIVAAFPAELADVPEKLRTRRHWKQLLSAETEASERVLAVLQELPAFTTQAPKREDRAGWSAVFARHMGTQQVRELLLEWHHLAGRARLKRPRVGYWREAYGAHERVQRVRPPEHDGYLPNPHRGTTTFQRFQGEDPYPGTQTHDTYGPDRFPTGPVRDNPRYIPRTTLTYCRWPWADLEPEKGRFAWDIVDRTLATAQARGQHAQLRFQPYTTRIDTATHPPRAQRFPPGASVNVPAWYWDTGAAWIEQGMFSKNEADMNDPRWLEHFGGFVSAFAARYDGHPALESIDIAYGGYWGEMGGNATDETAARLTDLYLAGFTRTQLLGMLGTAGCGYAAKRQANLGFRADCFGDFARADVIEVPYGREWNHTFDAYIQAIHRQGLQDAWKVAPVTMETCGNVALWAMMGYDLDRIVEFGLSYHTSVFMPKSAFFPEASLATLIDFDNRIGYRYLLRQALLPLDVARGGAIHAELYVENVGVAPIYRPYRVALRLRQGKRVEVLPFACDLRGWLPGPAFVEQDFTLPADFKRGRVDVDIGIIDQTDAPRVWLAIAGDTVDGWHPLTSIEAQ